MDEKEMARARAKRLADRRAEWHRVDTKVPHAEQAAILYALAKDMRAGKPYDLRAVLDDVLGHDNVNDQVAGQAEARRQLLDRFRTILMQARPQDLDKISRKLEIIEIVTAPPPVKLKEMP